MRERENEELKERERELLSNLHSSHRGYASTFKWSGQHSDETTRDRWGRRETQVVAIDALVFRSMMSQVRPGEKEKTLPDIYVHVPGVQMLNSITVLV